MSSRALRTVGTAFAERVAGAGPSGPRALGAAVVVAVAAGVATYRLLRSNGDDND